MKTNSFFRVLCTHTEISQVHGANWVSDEIFSRFIVEDFLEKNQQVANMKSRQPLKAELWECFGRHHMICDRRAHNQRRERMKKICNVTRDLFLSEPFYALTAVDLAGWRCSAAAACVEVAAGRR